MKIYINLRNEELSEKLKESLIKKFKGELTFVQNLISSDFAVEAHENEGRLFFNFSRNNNSISLEKYWEMIGSVALRFLANNLKS